MGLKILVYEKRKISRDKLNHFAVSVKPYFVNSWVYKPLKPVLIVPPTVNTKEALAQLLFVNFGAGRRYQIRYWVYCRTTLTKRKFSTLAEVELIETDNELGYIVKYHDLKNITKQPFWKKEDTWQNF